jgi:glycine cleavage system H lipoate-binding protein
MAIVFWNERGFILLKFLSRAPAVNSDHYAEILKPVTGPMIIEKAKSLYDEMKVCDKSTFSESWLHKITCKNLDQYRYLLII